MLSHRGHLAVICPILFCLINLGHAADSDLEEAIARHRMGSITIKTFPGSDVRVEQLQHEFWIGTARRTPMASAPYERFLENTGGQQPATRKRST